MTFEELYKKIVKASSENKLEEELIKIRTTADPNHLDCLLHPEKYPPVWNTGKCACSESESPCLSSCLFGAISRDKDGIEISKNDCIGCYACIDACKSKKLTASKDVVTALNLVFNRERPVYAIIAPAFIGQFSKNVTPGKLRSAFKLIGFAGMIEVAAFADILTLKEALEFDRNITGVDDYQLTSCCCPIWIAMIKKIYSQLLPHVPGSVSPMVACGRGVKLIYPEASVVFIGPCLAKKAEAKEDDIKDAVDCVLTFQEVRDVFEALDINPEELEDEVRDHSSAAGRIYARTGGVSEAVKTTVERITPNRTINLKAQQANGVKECKEMINDILEGKIAANFYEGMGCAGGCVGGPKIIIDKEDGRRNVNEYGEQSAYKTPIDNPYVIELLRRLGIESIDELLHESDIFSRHF